MGNLRIAKVSAIHPEGYAVDLTFLDNGAQVPWVQCMTPCAGTDMGSNDLAQPTPPIGGNPGNTEQTKNRDIYAVVGTVGQATPIVLGFLYPQVCQMLFADINRSVQRHPSDVYSTIDADGNAEFYHPSGTYFRIGATPAHEDLTGKDFDGRWKITKNTGAAVHAHLSVANAGAQVASIDIDPSGTVTIDAPQTNWTGNVTLTGSLDVNGSITVTGGDVTADGISLKNHVHPDPQGGDTGLPTG